MIFLDEHTISIPRRIFLASTLAVLAITLLFAAAPPRAVAKSAPVPAANTEYDPSQLEPGKPKKLDRPTTVGTYLCQGYVKYWKDGSLNQCRLAADAKIQGLDIPKGSTVWFYPGGSRIRRLWLSRAMTVQGIPCDGTRFSSGIDTIFYPDGHLEGAFLSAPATVQGLPLKKSGLCPVYLYENGKIKQGTLDKPAEVDGKQYPKDLTLFFDEKGKIVKTAPIPSSMGILKQLFSFGKRK